MREEGQFIRWLVFVTCLIFGVAKGIPAALILAIPEPLPSPAAATADAIWLGWDLHREAAQKDMLNQLQRQADAIEVRALLEVGVNPFAVVTTDADGCGHTQYDYDPALKRMMPVSGLQ